MVFWTKEDVISITSHWKGERFSDGRPKVSDKYLNALRNMTLEEIWKPIFIKGYENQFISMQPLEGYKKMINTAVQQYPNFKVVATTLRTVKTATVNDWAAMCWADNDIYFSKRYGGLEIYDRVGGGDSFASGFIYGLMETGDPQAAVDCGAAHGALAMTTPGDTSMASKKEVEVLIGGAGARVQR